MFSTATREDPIETLELRDTEKASVLVLAPGRGGMVTRWTVAGREVLYLEDAALRDPTDASSYRPGRQPLSVLRHGPDTEHAGARIPRSC